MKKIVALALALIMVLSMASVAFAAEVSVATADDLQAAINDANDGDIITLTADMSGKGLKITKGITIDFNGHTYNVTGDLVGSSGTESQGMQINAPGKTVVLKNGTFTSDLPARYTDTSVTPNVRKGIAVLINNYAELTLENMTLADTEANYYTLMVSNGTVTVTGNTYIGDAMGGADDNGESPAGGGLAAIVSPGVSSSYESTLVFDDTYTGTVAGDIVVEDAEMEVNGEGIFTDDIVANDNATIKISSGIFTEDVSDYLTDDADVTVIPNANTDGTLEHPGEKIVIASGFDRHEYKVKGYDFTTSTNDYSGASYIEDVIIEKDGDVVIVLKESYTLTKDRVLRGEVVLCKKADKNDTWTINVDKIVNNKVEEYIDGSKKASEAEDINDYWDDNTVLIMDEDGGYVSFSNELLKGVVKMNKEEKTFLNLIYGNTTKTEETIEAIEEYLGEEYVEDAIIEYYTFETRAFKNEVAFSYEAYEDDPHYFYLWNDGKLTKIDAKYNDDEDVEAWQWNAIAEGTIIVTDVEIVLAAEDAATKNPDTGATDVVGMASALAVVSLIAAGAVALKK